MIGLDLNNAFRPLVRAARTDLRLKMIDMCPLTITTTTITLQPEVTVTKIMLVHLLDELHNMSPS